MHVHQIDVYSNIDQSTYVAFQICKTSAIDMIEPAIYLAWASVSGFKKGRRKYLRARAREREREAFFLSH